MAKRGPADWTKTPEAKGKWRRTRAKVRQRQMDTVLANLRQGSTVTAACRAADIGHTTYRDWLKAYPKFRAAAEAELESRLTIVVDAMYAAASNGNTTAAAIWMKGHSEHWRKALCMSYVGGAGPDGAVPIKVDGLAGLFKAAAAKENGDGEHGHGREDTGRPGPKVHIPPAEGGPATTV